MRVKQLLIVLLLCGVAVAAGPQLTNVSVVAQRDTTVVTIQTTAPFVHNEYRPEESKMLIDLPGVSAGKLHDRTRSLQVPGLKSYHVVGYPGAAGVEVARVEFTLMPGAQVAVSEAKNALTLNITGPMPEAPVTPAVSDKQAQGKPTALKAADAKAPVTTSDVAQVRSVTAARTPEGTDVEIDASAPITGRTLKLTKPDRIVIDIPNSSLVRATRPISVQSQDVVAVRAGRFSAKPPVTRVVVDLRAPREFEVAQNGTKLVLKVRNASGAQQKPAAPAAAGVAKQQAAAIPSAKVDEPKKAEPTLVASAQPVAATSLPTANKVIPEPTSAKAEQPAKGSDNPAKEFVMVEPSYQAKAQTPAQPGQTTAPATQPTAAPQASTQAPPTPSTPLPVQPAVNFAAEQRQQGPSQDAKPRYTGEPISVNLKDVDIKDFFRLIHEISGLNIVLDPGVGGSLTLVLNDVPWDQALDIVLKNNSLDRQLDGNVLRIAGIDALRKEAEARRAQIQAQALAVDKVNVSRFLSYAHAADVLPTVKKLLSARGDAVADVRTNAVIIQDIPSVIPEIDRLLASLDRKTQEVEIEARVVAATRTFAREIGTQLGFGWGNGPTAVGGLPQLGNSPIIDNVTQNPMYVLFNKQVPFFSNLGLLQPTSGIALTNATNAYRVDVLLSAAESRGLLKILSRPRIVTQNNIQALVRQGQRIPVVTQGQLGGPPTVTYIDAFLRLTVTPQITAEGTIFLNLDVENTAPDFNRQVQGNPTLITQQATTQVLVTDGGTVVVGGVIQTQNSTNTAQIPLLGDIPVLGNLFKRRQVSTATQELIFFITPKIIQT